MNLKYYLRGLGIGTIVTALILGIALGNAKEPMSDEQIKKKARELGMVEPTGVLTEEMEQPTEVPQPTQEPQPTETPQPTQEPQPTETPQPTQEPQPTETPQPTQEPQPIEVPQPTQEPQPTEIPQPTEVPQPTQEPESDSSTALEIEVKRGEDSYTVCKKLEQVGFIKDASAFDRYLCENGYHTKIHAGVHLIPEGATQEEIAALLTR